MMKPSLSIPALSFVFLSAAVISAPIAFRGSKVVDTNGDPMRFGVQYYVLPVDSKTGGGLVPASRGFSITRLCPLDVVQSPLSFVPGIPVVFSTKYIYTIREFITDSTPLEIGFSVGVWLCPQSKLWKIDSVDKKTGQSFLTTGGSESERLPTERYWFGIRAVNDSYTIVYCSLGRCQDIGIYTDSLGIRRLALSDGGFAVKFQKVAPKSISDEGTTKDFSI